MRTRHQEGWIELTSAKTWKAHWYVYLKDPQTGEERRRHRSRIVGNKAEMPKYKATEELNKLLAPVNSCQTSVRDDRVLLRWFVEHRWRPSVEGNWGATTKKTNAHFIAAILEKFGDVPLRAIDRVDLQDWINGLAAKYSRSMVVHCYTCLKSICAEAVEQDFLVKDPGRRLKRPKTRKPDETVLEWPQYQTVIDAAKTLHNKLAIKVGSGTAVRPGELFGFRWRNLEKLVDGKMIQRREAKQEIARARDQLDLFSWEPNEAAGEPASGRYALRVTHTVYKSKLRPWAKTENSAGLVPLPRRLAAELLEWRKVSEWPREQDFIFPNSLGGFGDYENFEARVLEPIRKKLGLAKLNFQILRRTYATRAVAERKGTVKDVQSILRHTRPDITLENYVKEVPESVHSMVDAMYDEIAGPAEIAEAAAGAPVQAIDPRKLLEQIAPVGGVQ